jgi:hypothetical protein
MENTDTPIQNQESTPVVEPVIEITPTTIENTPIINGEQITTEETPLTENGNTIEDEIVPPSLPTTEEEITKPTDEQENVIDTNTTVPPTSLSPVRANIPLKEVNESEKEEAAVITNGTENGISKKRELEQEDEQTDETTNDNDERNVVDQIKKIKTSEVTDTPIMETIEPENNILVNGNTAVEV